MNHGKRSLLLIAALLSLAAVPACDDAMATGIKPAPGSASSGGFGSDTSIPLANSAAVDVQAARFVTSLANNTSGSEASNWTLSLMDNGTARGVVAFGPTTTFMTPNTVVATHQVVINSTAGSGQASMAVQVGSVDALILRGDSAHNGTLASGSGGDLYEYTNGDGGYQAIHFANTTHDTIIGNTGTLATNATGGFVWIHGGAGVPTGTPAGTGPTGTNGNLGGLYINLTTGCLYTWTSTTAAWVAQCRSGS